MRDTITVEIKLEQQMCDNCIRKDPQYFKDKIFLRGKNKEELEKIAKFIETLYINEINKIKEVKEGIDFYLSTSVNLNKLLNKLYRDYLIVYKKDPKLVGFDKLRSKNKYKVTHLVEIEDIKKGDKVCYNGKKYIVKTFYKDSITLINNTSKKVLTYSLNRSKIRKI